MSSPDTLLQAALQRLVARLGSGAMDAAAQLSLLAQDAPQRLQEELQLFWEEVQQEADRMDNSGRPSPAAGAPAAAPDVQQQLDQLRQQVASFTKRLEEQA
jgi:uncharacterized protein YceH (UPF0502 family)